MQVFEKCFTIANWQLVLTADIKVGVKNSYEILKYDGKEREVIYDIYQEDGEVYQEIPSGCFQSKERQNSWTWMQVMEETGIVQLHPDLAVSGF